MAKNLEEMIVQKPDLFKDVVRYPVISKRLIAMITGIQMWGKRSKIPVNRIRISGPTGPVSGYDTSFKISRKEA